MPDSLLFFLGGGLLLAWLVYFVLQYIKRRRRRRLRDAPLRPEYRAVLERNVPLYRKLPAQLRPVLEGHVNVFLREKKFIGCGGLEITDEMRVTVAGNACLLLLSRPDDYFRGFINILMYPDAFIAPEEHWDGEIVTQGESIRAGESWHGGPVVLSWGDVLDGIEHADDGENVVLHEFAHKLDEQNGDVDGLPVLHDRDDYEDWAQVLTREFADLQARVAARQHHVIDEYGATSAPEFFAVATESFFERGARMKQQLPELYGQLQKYYGVDPAAWS